VGGGAAYRAAKCKMCKFRPIEANEANEVRWEFGVNVRQDEFAEEEDGFG
jgi:hypothetical protein